MGGGQGSDVRGRKFGGKESDKRLHPVGRLEAVLPPPSSKRVWPRLRIVGAQTPTKIAVSSLPLGDFFPRIDVSGTIHTGLSVGLWGRHTQKVRG